MTLNLKNKKCPLHTCRWTNKLRTLLCVHVHIDAGGDQRVVGKGKRQAWTAAAIEAFFEGLYQVLVYTCTCI